MQANLVISGPDVKTWEEVKPVVIAAALKATSADRIKVQETAGKIVIELGVNQAFNAMGTLLHYFKKEYTGLPVNLVIEIKTQKAW